MNIFPRSVKMPMPSLCSVFFQDAVRTAVPKVTVPPSVHSSSIAAA